jgi:RNA polymerase sigma-70 factor, ECF subfamily
MDSDFEKLWGIYQNSLLRYITDKVQNKYDAEDILQDVFIKVHQNFHNIKDKSSIQTYIYQTAKNTIIDYYRRIQDIPLETVEFSDEFISDGENLGLYKELSRCLKNILEDLPEKYQKSIKLYDINGKKHKDVSEQLKLTISGSKTRVQRGRHKLKEMLLECCDFEFDALGNVINYKQKNNDKCKKWCK